MSETRKTAARMDQHFRNEVKRPFSEALKRFDNLVRIAIDECSNYEDRPLDDNYFRNPLIQGAISATHVALTEVNNIAQRHVKKYTNLICQQTATTGELERTVNRHRNEIEILVQSKKSLESTLASLQDSVNHAENMLDNTRELLNEQHRQLAVRQQTRNVMKWLIWVPIVGPLGYIASECDVCDSRKRVQNLEKDLRDHQEATDKAQEQVNQENAKIAENEYAAAKAVRELLQTRTSLDSLRLEMDTVLKVGEKVKSSMVFIAEFQGKVNVLYETNRLEVMFDTIVKSLGELLPFIATHIDNQVAVLASTESLQKIRRLLTTRILPSAEDLRTLEF